MKRSTRSTSLLSLSIALAGCVLTGCNEDPGAGNGKGDHMPAPLPSSTTTTPAYPPGPYALTQGGIIADADFSGYVDAHASKDALQTIRLSDFYNPHANDPSQADRLYPAGSQYGAGTKKPRALLIDIASVWCAPCNEEAKQLLPALYAKYKPCGGEFLFQLVEGVMPNTPATPEHLTGWTTRYDVRYPATYDPARKLNAIYSSGYYPDAAIIDTTTMKVVTMINGLPDDGFWKTYESLLDAACLTGK